MLTQNKSPASRWGTSARTPWHRSSVPPHLELLRLPGDFGRGPGGPKRWRFHHEKMVSHMGILMWYNKGCYQELKIDGGVDGFFWILFEVNGSMIQRWEMSKKRKYLVGGSFNPEKSWTTRQLGWFSMVPNHQPVSYLLDIYTPNDLMGMPRFRWPPIFCVGATWGSPEETSVFIISPSIPWKIYENVRSKSV